MTLTVSSLKLLSESVAIYTTYFVSPLLTISLVLPKKELILIYKLFAKRIKTAKEEIYKLVIYKI